MQETKYVDSGAIWVPGNSIKDEMATATPVSCNVKRIKSHVNVTSLLGTDDFRTILKRG